MPGHFADFLAGRISCRKMLNLIQHLPPEAHTSRALGGHGFSMLELLTMESPGLAGGSLNPRHPWNDAESQRTADRAELLKSRRAYYEDLSRQQDAEQTPQSDGSPASDI